MLAFAEGAGFVVVIECLELVSGFGDMLVGLLVCLEVAGIGR